MCRTFPTPPFMGDRKVALILDVAALAAQHAARNN